MTFARGLARLLRAAGFNVETFASAAAFLAPGRVQPEGLGCVLLDVRMPGMRGPELQRTMLERGIGLPVIFLTGHGDVATSVDAMKHGAVDFLEKPVAAGQLVGAIRVAIERHGAERARAESRREIEARIGRLSRREREVMGHVIAGRLNKQIAVEMSISLKTVKAHRARVMEKMAAGSVPALVDMCRTAGVGPAAPAQRISPLPFQS